MFTTKSDLLALSKAGSNSSTNVSQKIVIVMRTGQGRLMAELGTFWTNPTVMTTHGILKTLPMWKSSNNRPNLSFLCHGYRQRYQGRWMAVWLQTRHLEVGIECDVKIEIYLWNMLTERSEFEFFLGYIVIVNEFFFFFFEGGKTY